MILESIFVSSFLFALSSTQNDIRKPPTIIRSPPKSMIYRSDESIILVCNGEGVPALEYEWKKNGIKVSQTARNINRSADGTLTIHPATLVDEGFYQCFARNQYGTALSNTTHLQRAFLGSSTRNSTDVLNKTVPEGKPFHIPADPRQGFPKAVYSWEVANDTEDRNPIPIRTSQRIQIAENGDLYFAYALPMDDVVGRFYRCSTYNPYLDVKAGGSYTHLTVIRNSTGISSFAPTVAFASEAQVIALIGGNVTLRCFFYGYPEPTIVWSGPRNTLPIGRHMMINFYTELFIRNIAASDEGDYICAASNIQGHNTSSIHIRVEAVPTFIKVTDGPCDVNVTEGVSVKFSCNASAKPEAKIVWFQDGKQLDLNNLPRRFVISNDNKSLTIVNVCRNCTDRENKTDLTVIQCNASNVHGYAFASGYLNVLIRTKVILEGERYIEVQANDERQIQFACRATSDPSTPPSVRWYKLVNNEEKLVHDEPPTVVVKDGVLNISVNPNSTRKWEAYEGRYRCIADNGYSRDSADVNVMMLGNIPPLLPPKKPISVWWIYIGIGVSCAVVFLLVIITGVICVRRGRRRTALAGGAPHGMGARRCDYVRTSDIGPFRREYPTEETTLTSSPGSEK